MAKSKNKKRLYETDDAKMLQFATLTHSTLEEHFAAFTAFDAHYTVEFLDAFKNEIVEARNFSSDYQLMANMASLSEKLGVQMGNCCDYFQFMKYFVEKAFEGNNGTLSEFGFKEFGKVRKSHEKMIQFMFDLHEAATKYATELVNVGSSASQIAEIEVLANNLKAAKSAQVAAKGERTTATNNRIKLFNKVFKTVKLVCKAGKTVYVKDDAMYVVFFYPWGK